ncbi:MULTISPECIES: hypothetical protein [Acidobacterium]|uniref:Uncharacterized protein n=1 Tax=Acidobacterium capsulatum (strain ATCC 51196 / DSM 11244 / BCRC 80197 / JCM 7670 / NBRC 15755 / NCIMB 13165 / 161) TaxID=240015 RepID=C1F3G7_ACIC5|nr:MULTISPECIES: hypothetical protein [Acidobacterium]ACO31299.1 hypothetical protein ACP_0957 [Acidobacterium capsulatum ATCC 51196]
MTPTTQSTGKTPASSAVERALWKKLNAQDGTLALLRTGGWTLFACGLAYVLAGTVLGGMTPQGPRTIAGWMAVIVSLMTLPFGVLVFLLGLAKALRNRRLARHAADESRG